MFCRNCGKEIPNNTNFCNYCGANQKLTNSNNKNKNVSKLEEYIVGIILIIGVIAIVYLQLKDIINPQDNSGSSTSVENATSKGLDKSEEFYPFYAQMDEVEKVTYEEILSGVKEGLNEIHLSKSEELYVSTVVSDIAMKISYEHPELFWFKGTVTCYADNYHHIVYVTPDYNNLIEDLENNKNEIETVVDKLLLETDGMSDVEAEKYFNDYLCENVAYATGEYDQTIYSTFVQKKTVCSGYAHGFQYLMMRRNVPCYFTTGWAFNFHTKETGRHAWNIIKLDGNFYNCDVTFADRALEENVFPSYISYEYFNVPDDKLKDGKHSRDTYGMLLPDCMADDKNYNVLYGIDWEYTIMSDYPENMVTTLDEFYDFLYERLVAYGSGVHDFTFVMKKDVYYQIQEYGTNDMFSQKVSYPAAEALGFENWSNSSWNANYYGIDGDEYIFVEMHLELI